MYVLIKLLITSHIEPMTVFHYYYYYYKDLDFNR